MENTKLPEKSLQRNVKVQILRALAIIAVVIIHSHPSKTQLGIFLRPFINFAVPMFVFLSGYLTKLDIEHPVQFIKKRFVRMIIPYTIWSLIYTILYGTGEKFIYNYITGNACYTFYYVIVYLQLVLVTPFLKGLAISKYKYIGFLVTPIALILRTFIFGYLQINHGIFYEVHNFLGIIRWFTYYYLGILLSNKLINLKISRKKLCCLLIVSLVLQIFTSEIWNYLGNYAMATTASRLSPFFTNILILLLAYKWLNNGVMIDRNDKHFKFLFVLGDYSFGIYLAHIIVLSVVNHIIPVFPINSVLCLCLNLLCAIIGRKILGDRFGKYIGLF